MDLIGLFRVLMIWIVLKAETDTCVRLLGASTVEELGPRFVSASSVWTSSQVRVPTANLCSGKHEHGRKGHIRRTERLGQVEAVDEVETVVARWRSLFRTLARVTSLASTPVGYKYITHIRWQVHVAWRICMACGIYGYGTRRLRHARGGADVGLPTLVL